MIQTAIAGVKRLEWAGDCCEFKGKREWAKMERTKHGLQI
jgi:hypothetical protein